MTSTRTLAAACAISALCGTAFAQVVDFDPIPGLEQRANRHQYLTSHNAYDNDTWSLALQLDALNVWDLELDVRFNNEGQSNPLDRYEIFHDCVTAFGTFTLNQACAEVKTTQRYNNGLFFLNIELGDAWGFCDDWDDLTPAQHDRNVDDILKWHFGNAAYTRSDFLSDGSKWPSVQELVRRGKRVIPHIRYQGPSSALERYIKRSASTNNSLIVWNSDNPNAVLDDLDDNHLARYWDSCSSVDWLNALNSGFSFVATDCVYDWFIGPFGQLVHPPYPMYVRTFSLGSQGGTAGLPFVGGAGIIAAGNRASVYSSLAPVSTSHTSRAGIIPVLVTPGTYSVSTAGQVIGGPIILQSRDGSPVTLN